MTNYPISYQFRHVIDILYPIHEKDVFQGRQWKTRVLYNAYPPFALNFVIDTHIFPCDKYAMSELFERFNKTDVDVSFGNRMNHRDSVMGGGALFRSNNASHFFWKNVFRAMVTKDLIDDQNGMAYVLKAYGKRERFKFEWLSFNWLFATHGVNENGQFKGAGKCYRTSLPVNGPVRFLHGVPEQCTIINGENGKHTRRVRAWFEPGVCKTKETSTQVAFSEEEYKAMIHPSNVSELYWGMFSKFPRNELFWPEREEIGEK